MPNELFYVTDDDAMDKKLAPYNPQVCNTIGDGGSILKYTQKMRVKLARTDGTSYGKEFPESYAFDYQRVNATQWKVKY